jgi:myosin heavy subunit
MANALASLARGLRSAGGVVSPAVSDTIAKEDMADQAAQRQVGLMQLQERLRREAQESSPQYQAQLEALKNEKLFREAVAGAGGDMTKIAGAAVQYGKPELAINLFNQQEARAARAQQAAEALETKRLQLEQTHQLNLQRITDGQQRQAEIERHNREMEAASARSAALQAEVAKGNQELKRMQFEIKADKETKAKVQQLGAALEKANLPEADAVLGAVEDVLTKKPEIAEYLSGPKSLIPDMAVGTEIATGRQAFQKLFNITLKNRSGAAVTNPELERLKSEFASGAFKTAPQLKSAVEKARTIINQHYASVTAGFGKDALKAYNENIRGLGGRVVLEPASDVSDTPAAKYDDPLGLRK